MFSVDMMMMIATDLRRFETLLKCFSTLSVDDLYVSLWFLIR